MRFKIQISPQTESNLDDKMYCIPHNSMSFNKIKAMKKTVRMKLKKSRSDRTNTFPFWLGGSKTLSPEENGTSCLVKDHVGLKEQNEKAWWRPR